MPRAYREDVPRRRDLKPAKPVSDEALLRAAKGSATRAANRLERARRAEAAAAEARAIERGQGKPAKPASDEAT